MRVSVVNFCSTAVEMLDFSSRMLMDNAGTGDFDYIVVTWNPTDEVLAWLKERPGIFHRSYETRPELDYVPNLRAMMSQGFDEGYKLNDYVAIVNTDMAFGHEWLANLARRASEDVVPNSVHLTPVSGEGATAANFGVPTDATFDLTGFWQMHDRLRAKADQDSRDSGLDQILTVAQRGGNWRSCATMPYVVHRKWWERFGPWAPNVEPGKESPDRQFFGRCAAGGARLILCLDSVVYHHEKVERTMARRPVGIENMPNGV